MKKFFTATILASLSMFGVCGGVSASQPKPQDTIILPQEDMFWAPITSLSEKDKKAIELLKKLSEPARKKSRERLKNAY